MPHFKLNCDVFNTHNNKTVLNATFILKFSLQYSSSSNISVSLFLHVP